nr:MASE1 domain-containing protein [Burkholderiaceae bacterium]
MTRWWWRSLLVAVAYVAAGRLGLVLDSPSPFISVFWPALGGALAVLVRWGPGMVPALLVGAVGLQLSVGAPITLAVGIALGNVGAPWAASRWLLRTGFNPQLTQRRDLWLLLGAGGLGATACTALNGASWLAATGRILPHDWPEAVLQWWAGDTLGLLVAGVPLLTLSRRSLDTAFAPQRRHLSLALLAGAGVLLAASVITTPWLGLGGLALLLAPPVLLCGLAMRAGLATASAAVLAGSLAMVAFTAAGQGPFAQLDQLQPGNGRLLLWAFSGALAALTLVAHALAGELVRL